MNIVKKREENNQGRFKKVTNESQLKKGPNQYHNKSNSKTRVLDIYQGKYDFIIPVSSSPKRMSIGK